MPRSSTSTPATRWCVDSAGDGQGRQTDAAARALRRRGQRRLRRHRERPSCTAVPYVDYLHLVADARRLADRQRAVVPGLRPSRRRRRRRAAAQRSQSRRAPGTRTRPASSSATASACSGSATATASPTILLLPTWSIVHSRHWKAPDPLPRPPLPGRHLRRARQRALRPAARSGGLRRHGVRRRRGRRPGRDRHGPGGRRRPVDGRAATPLRLAIEHPDRVLGLVMFGPVDPARRRVRRRREAAPTPRSRIRSPTTRAGTSTTPTTGAATGRASPSGSSGRSSPSRTRRSRSRTASAGSLETDPETIIAAERAPFMRPPADWEPGPPTSRRGAAFAAPGPLPRASSSTATDDRIIADRARAAARRRCSARRWSRSRAAATRRSPATRCWPTC